MLDLSDLGVYSYFVGHAAKHREHGGWKFNISVKSTEQK